MSSQSPQAALLERWDWCVDTPEEDTDDVAALAELVEVFDWCELIDFSEAQRWRDRLARLQAGTDAAHPWPAATRERARALLDDLFPSPDRPVERPWELASNGAETIAAALRRLGLISDREEKDYHGRLWPEVQTPGGPAIDGGPAAPSRVLIAPAHRLDGLVVPCALLFRDQVELFIHGQQVRAAGEGDLLDPAPRLSDARGTNYGTPSVGGSRGSDDAPNLVHGSAIFTVPAPEDIDWLDCDIGANRVRLTA